MRAVNIEWVMMLTANVMDGCCDCAVKRANQYILMADAPDLPLPGCDARKCLCMLTAIQNPQHGSV